MTIGPATPYKQTSYQVRHDLTIELNRIEYGSNVLGDPQEDLQDRIKSVVQTWQRDIPEDYETLSKISKAIDLIEKKIPETLASRFKKRILSTFASLDPYGRGKVFFKQMEKFKGNLYAISLIEQDPNLFFNELGKDLKLEHTALNDLLSLAIEKLEKNGKLKSFLSSMNEQHFPETLRIGIAKIAAAKSNSGLSENIDKFAIQDENSRVEIAKIAAAKYNSGLSENIDKFAIQDENSRVEIAKIAATQPYSGLSKSIDKFDIQDESSRVEIAIIEIINNDESVYECISNYKLEDQKNLKNLAERIFLRFPLKKQCDIKRFVLDNENPEKIPTYKELLLKRLAFGLLQIATISPQDFADLSQFYILLGKTLSPEKLSEIDSAEFFAGCIENLEKDLPENIKKQSPCKYVLKWRNKPIVYFLMETFFSEVKSAVFKKNYMALAKTMPDRPLSILPAKWMGEAEAENPPAELVQFFERFRKDLKSKGTGLMQLYFLATQALDSCKDVLPSRKLELLCSVCSRRNLQEILKGLAYLYSFSTRKQSVVLNELDTEDPISSSRKFFERLLSEDSYLSIPHNIPNFFDLYMKSFDHTRIPLALDIYKQRLSILEEEEEEEEEPVKIAFNRFVQSVLLETFNEERFRTDINPHLKHIEQNDGQLFNAWKSLQFSAPVGTLTKEAPVTQFSFEKFFKTKLGDNHWHQNGVDCLPELTAYLQKRAIQNTPSPILLRCKALIEDHSSSKEKQIKHIQAILETLTSPELRDLEINNDLKDLIQTLNSSAKASSDERVILSKDWEDLLLSGTEVAGSCQRIDGDPKLNRCLLAYCMDGKNALLAVKKGDGKILARSVLRVLWNEKSKKPVLFLDRLYPGPCPPEREAAIVDAAKECAKILNCELFTCSDAHPEAFDIVLKALRGPCPYEYADAAGGIKWGGEFQITKNLQSIKLN